MWKYLDKERPMVLFEPSLYFLAQTTRMQRVSLCVFLHLASRLESDGSVEWKTTDIAEEIMVSPRLVRRGLAELQKHQFIARKNRSRSRWLLNPDVVKPAVLSY